MVLKRVEYVGLEKLVGLLVKMGPDSAPALGQALYAEAQLAFRQSQVEVPFRFGILKGSGRVMPPEIIGETVDVSLGYGGAASMYALYMHEQTGLAFRKGKKAHYLSDPVQARVQGMDRRILKRIEAIVERNKNG